MSYCLRAPMKANLQYLTMVLVEVNVLTFRAGASVAAR